MMEAKKTGLPVVHSQFWRMYRSQNSQKPQKGHNLTLIPLNPEEGPASVG